MGYEDEYEVIPTSPIRRIEKRLEQVEAGTYPTQTRKLIEQIIELIKSNQRIIDDSIKANNDLRNELSKIPDKIDSLLSNMNEFMNMLKASATEETVSEVSKETMKPLLEKLTELVDQNKKSYEANQATLTTLELIEKRLKRLFIQPTQTTRTGTGLTPPASYGR
jgi:chromosome segregation ATPase